MPETPFQFRHEGQVAGLRSAATPVEYREHTPEAKLEAPPRPRRRTWSWLAVPCVSVVVAVSWLFGIDALSIGSAEISLPAAAVLGPGDSTSVVKERANTAIVPEDGEDRRPAPSSAQVGVESVLSTAAPPGGAQRAVTHAPRPTVSPGRSRPRATPLPEKPGPIQFDLSIVKVRYLDGRLAPSVIAVLSPAIPAIRSCIGPILQLQPDLKGTVTATVSARDGKVSAVNVESGIRHTRLRFCFRQALMSRAVSNTDAEPSFDARVEFFVLPRVSR